MEETTDKYRITTYVKTDNSKKYLVLIGSRRDFRRRQRNKDTLGNKTTGLKFCSYKELVKNNNKYVGIYDFNTLSKL